MRFILIAFWVISSSAQAQWKDYKIGVKGDTLNIVDKKDQKQGKWINHFDEVRGEPGYEEEGIYKNNRKEGPWRLYNLNGDLTGLEYYKWGNKDGICQYFNGAGELIREESWKALNPDKQYDTLQIEDIDHLDQYRTVIVKNEGAAIKNGTWKYYNPTTGMIFKQETYTIGKLETPKASKSDSTSTSATAKTMAKPKEVQDYEKKNAGKKKIRVRDGATGN
jgi:antitoxin component YwqK of YwqJK toxin-antitoxin module